MTIIKIEKSTIFVYKIHERLVFCFTMYKTRKYAQLKKMGVKRPKSPI